MDVLQIGGAYFIGSDAAIELVEDKERKDGVLEMFNFLETASVRSFPLNFSNRSPG